ncbi:MAG: LptF/LptG family permease, partial [Planctomycetales bacterium]|nr:LptF/LptG family permease [Planctomycetales bacterium]
MRILTRYVLIEFLKVFIVVLGSMTMMMILLVVVKEARDLGFGPAQVARLVPYILPDALRFTVPGTALFAVCNLYGRMSSSNEIVAIKSLGIHPKTVLMPVGVIVFVLSLATVWLNDLAVSWGRQGIRQVALESVEEIALSALRTQGSYSTNKFAINVRSVDGRRLIKPIIMFEADGDSDNVTIRAEEAELRADPAGGVLSIVLRDGNASFSDGGSVEFPDQIPYNIDLNDFSRAGREYRGPSNLSLREIREATPAKRRE